MSEGVIGVTLVAIGTSLPELATAVVAAVRRHGDVALGNALGSNVFNVFGMLGLTAAIVPVRIDPAFLALDLWLMLGVSALLLGMLSWGNRLGRVDGVLLLLACPRGTEHTQCQPMYRSFCHIFALTKRQGRRQ